MLSHDEMKAKLDERHEVLKILDSRIRTVVQLVQKADGLARDALKLMDRTITIPEGLKDHALLPKVIEELRFGVIHGEEQRDKLHPKIQAVAGTEHERLLDTVKVREQRA